MEVLHTSLIYFSLAVLYVYEHLTFPLPLRDFEDDAHNRGEYGDKEVGEKEDGHYCFDHKKK